MKKSLTLIVLAATLALSRLANANDWQGYSLTGGTRSYGITFDQFNDFFPIFWGLGAHKFHTEEGLDPKGVTEGHIGFGLYYFNVTIGAGYANDERGDNVAYPFSVGGSFALDEAKKFSAGPYATYWPYEEGTKSEIGVKFTYSPTGLRSR